MDAIYGINPIKEALRSTRAGLAKILIAKGKRGREIEAILALAGTCGIGVEFVDQSVIDSRTKTKANQGIAALCSPYRYARLEELLAPPSGPFQNRLLLILDCIADPQNLGSLIRTAHCFGAGGLIIPKDRAAQVTPAVVKASAGAVYLTPVAMVTNLGHTIGYLKEGGFWIYGADAETGQDMSSLDMRGDIALIVGSEGGGLRKLTKQNCDFLISIPMYVRSIPLMYP